MNFSDRNSFGCNILQIGNVTQNFSLERIVNKVKNCYANVLMFNVIAIYEDEVEELLHKYPVIHKTMVPSSMGNYNTILYVLDCSQEKKNQGWRRGNPKFQSIDGKYWE
jgi:hypothetical protein